MLEADKSKAEMLTKMYTAKLREIQKITKVKNTFLVLCLQEKKCRKTIFYFQKKINELHRELDLVSKLKEMDELAKALDGTLEQQGDMQKRP